MEDFLDLSNTASSPRPAISSTAARSARVGQIFDMRSGLTAEGAVSGAFGSSGGRI